MNKDSEISLTEIKKAFDFFFQRFFIFLFALIATISGYEIIVTGNLNVEIYLIPLWSAPLAYGSLIGSVFYLFCIYKFQSWKYALTIFLFFDTLFETQGTFYLFVINRLDELTFGNGLIIEIVIVSSFGFSIFLLRWLKIQWNKRRYLLISSIAFMELNSFHRLFPNEMPFLIALSLAIYLTFNLPKNILT